jgi:hypothetical protein
MSATGEVTYKSMVYTDYFVKGREPQRTCVVHKAQYVPYPEPYFAATAFDNLPPLAGMEHVTPEPVFAAVPPEHSTMSPIPAALPPAAPVESAPAPVLPKHVIQVPASPPESAPHPEPPARPEPPASDETISPALPPPEPAEAPPQGP